MNNSEVYNLEKLKWVLCGMIISAIGSIVCGIVLCFFMEAILLEIVIQIFGCIIFISGLKAISKYVRKFKKAFVWAIISMGITINTAAWIIMGLDIVSTVHSDSDLILQLVLVIFVVIAAFVIIGIGIYIKFLLLKGIEEISMKLGEEKFAKKLNNFWYTYICTVIIAIIFAIITFITFPILIIIALIACGVISILLYVYIFKGYKILNGRKIPDENVK